MFQQLMQKVLSGLKTDFAEVYINDVLIFSDTLEEHLSHRKSISFWIDLRKLTQTVQVPLSKEVLSI